MTSTTTAVNTTASFATELKALFTGSLCGQSAVSFTDHEQHRAVRKLLATKLPHGVEFGMTNLIWLDFDAEWANGTGYYDGLVHEVLPGSKEIKPSNSASNLYISVDTAGRLILVALAPTGNIVLFNRYNNNPEIMVANVPSALSTMFSSNIHAEVINMVTCGALSAALFSTVRVVAKKMKHVNIDLTGE